MTKEREIIVFVKSQPPFDVHRQYLNVSLRLEFQGFAANFSLFC